MSFGISMHRDGWVTVLRLSGELDLQPAAGLRQLFDELAERGRRDLLVDVAQVTFCDSTGLSALIHGYRRCRAAGGSLRVVGDTGMVDRVLRLTGVHDLLVAQPDRAPPGARDRS